MSIFKKIFKFLFRKGAIEEDEYIYYIHDEPDCGEIEDMPMYIEEPERGTGMYDPNIVRPGQAYNPYGIPDGINVPGVGYVGGNRQQPSAQEQAYQQQMYMQRMQGGQYPQASQQPMQQPMQPMQQMQVPVAQTPTPISPWRIEYVGLKNASHVFIDLPGISRENTTISVIDGLVTIRGMRVSSADKLMERLESRPDNVSRKSTVPDVVLGEFEFELDRMKRMIDEKEITYDYNDGILEIILPFRDEVSITLGVGGDAKKKKSVPPKSTPRSSKPRRQSKAADGFVEVE